MLTVLKTWFSNWKLILAAILIAVVGTLSYAFLWEGKHAAVQEDRAKAAQVQAEDVAARAKTAAKAAQAAVQEQTHRAKEVDRAMQAHPDFSGTPVPDDVRNELCKTLDCKGAG